MEQKKSFEEMAKNIQPLREDELGKLKGGFSAINVKSIGTTVDDVNNCPCSNSAAGCGVSTNPGTQCQTG